MGSEMCIRDRAKTQLEESANHLMVLYTSEQDGSDNGENNL